MTITETAPAPAKRPYWQIFDCPEWCVAEHFDGDHGAHRNHGSDWTNVVLLQEEPREIPNGTDMEIYPAALELGLVQGEREVEPHVELVHHVLETICLTLPEAEELATVLLDLVATAGGPKT
jgi:hypothetical protein